MLYIYTCRYWLNPFCFYFFVVVHACRKYFFFLYFCCSRFAFQTFQRDSFCSLFLFFFASLFTQLLYSHLIYVYLYILYIIESLIQSCNFFIKFQQVDTQCDNDVVGRCRISDEWTDTWMCVTDSAHCASATNAFSHIKSFIATFQPASQPIYTYSLHYVDPKNSALHSRIQSINAEISVAQFTSRSPTVVAFDRCMRIPLFSPFFLFTYFVSVRQKKHIFFHVILWVNHAACANFSCIQIDYLIIFSVLTPGNYKMLYSYYFHSEENRKEQNTPKVFSIKVCLHSLRFPIDFMVCQHIVLFATNEYNIFNAYNVRALHCLCVVHISLYVGFVFRFLSRRFISECLLFGFFKLGVNRSWKFRWIERNRYENRSKMTEIPNSNADWCIFLTVP